LRARAKAPAVVPPVAPKKAIEDLVEEVIANPCLMNVLNIELVILAYLSRGWKWIPKIEVFRQVGKI
jgi:hypothetical protein